MVLRASRPHLPISRAIVPIRCAAASPTNEASSSSRSGFANFSSRWKSDATWVSPISSSAPVRAELAGARCAAHAGEGEERSADQHVGLIVMIESQFQAVFVHQEPRSERGIADANRDDLAIESLA